MNKYELGYTPTNLSRIMAQANATNAGLARLLGVSPDTVCRWRTPTGRSRHADMPTGRWLQAVNILEANYSICLQHLEDEIRQELIGQNLVYIPGQLAPIHLVCRYRGNGKWTLFTQYGPSDNEEFYSLDVGIDVGLIDYQNEEGSDEEIEQESSDRMVDENARAWAVQLMAELGPYSYDGRKVG